MTTTRDIYTELAPLLRNPLPPKQDGRIWSFCPTHPDGTKQGKRSLSLHPQFGLECFAGCKFRDIVGALREGQPRSAPDAPRGQQERLTATYRYVTPDGQLVAEKGRWESLTGKRFSWKRTGESEWGRLDPVKVDDLPVYNADMLRQLPMEEVVYFVEGEKAADTCVRNGVFAVSLAGGASQRTFGDSLKVLAGRTVVLWPDNDVPGREFMVAVQGALKGIAKAVHFVTLPFPLPEKGDAHDYFGLGGNAAKLVAATITRPVAEVLSFDGVRVRVPVQSEVYTFTFDGIANTNRSFDVELSIQREGDTDVYQERINILSSSQRTELRRSLDTLYGKEKNWTLVLNQVISLARQTYLGIDRSIDVAEIVDDGQDLLVVDPLLPADSPTIVYGDGGASKSFVIFSMALHFALGASWLGMRTPKQRVLVVDYEGSRTSFRRRFGRMARGMGYPDVPPDLVQWWPGRGIALADQIDAVKAKVDSIGAGLVVIDSAVPACGSDPNKAEVAGAYFRALSKLGVATVTIAHIDKRENVEKPFGSVFWHNEARRTWYVKREQEDEGSEIDVGMYCKKVNDGVRPRDIAVHLSFDDPVGPIVVTTGDFAQSPELQSERPMASRVWDALAGGVTRTISEIHEVVGGKRDSVDRTVRRFVTTGKIVRMVGMRGDERVTVYGRAAL